ncbi:pyridoxamine 5'-phosphate oxidase family protein [Nonomuraea sp. NPDC049480]|uniref:pyridoxamine 5'-phosphate oxidase family protein n=1 Tax=Nonomuraea sp. NPDC049480 TaxID=3364353 RepID=UPI0037951282
MSELPQGDVRLLDHEVARKLLTSTELARVAYVAKDGTPRVLPMLFHWNGEELVLPTFSGSAKLPALRARPDVAITIDVPGPPPEVLLIRGRAEIIEVDGLLPEYRAAHHRYYGEEQGERNLAQADQPGVRMGRIAVRPTWVGVLDFQTRLPGILTRS